MGVWVDSKCIQKILNKVIAGNRCLAGSEGNQAERTQLGTSERRQIVEAQALEFGIHPKFPGSRPGRGGVRSEDHLVLIYVN